MKIDHLLGLAFVPDENLHTDELVLGSTYMDRKLSERGLTLAKNIPAYEAVLNLIRSETVPADHSIQIFSLEYKGEKALPQDAARVTANVLKKSDYIRLKDLSSEAFEPIHALVWKWVDDQAAQDPAFSVKLMEKGCYKQTPEGLKPKLTATRLIIADYPELISLIHEHPAFNHLDAISYEIRINGQMEEFITIFSDANLMLDDFAKNQKHVRGSMSNYKGYIVLPETVVKTSTLQQLDSLRKSMQGQDDYKVA